MKAAALAVTGILITSFLFAISLYYGYMEGIVKDEDNSPVKGVLVVVTPKSSKSNETQTMPSSCEEALKKKGSQKATTGSTGRYKFVVLRPGTYNACYSSSGFSTVRATTEIKEGVTSNLDVVLKRQKAEQQTQTNH